MPTPRLPGGLWSITSGSQYCESTLLQGAACVTDGDGDYTSGEACNVVASVDLYIYAVQFNVRSGMDGIIFAQSQPGFATNIYTGVNFPGKFGSNVRPMAAGDSFSWQSSGVQSNSASMVGWIVCGTLNAPPTSPPPALSSPLPPPARSAPPPPPSPLPPPARSVSPSPPQPSLPPLYDYKVVYNLTVESNVQTAPALCQPRLLFPSGDHLTRFYKPRLC